MRHGIASQLPRTLGETEPDLQPAALLTLLVRARNKLSRVLSLLDLLLLLFVSHKGLLSIDAQASVSAEYRLAMHFIKKAPPKQGL